MKKSILTIIAILTVAVSISDAQSYQWAKRMGSYGVDFARGVATDAQGNVYVVGQFEFDGYFNGNNSVTFTVRGTHDIFVAKYDPNGNLLWARQAGGSSGDAGSAIFVDAAGNVYITGETEGTSYFESTVLNCAGSNDAFIAKYDTNGNLIFAVQAGGYSGDRGRGITADAAGNVYLTGEFRETAHFGPITVTTGGIYKDFFLAKYNPSVGWIWVKTGGSSVDDQGQAICLDNAGNIYVTGYYGPNATFGSTAMSSAGSFDLFIAKYTSSGTMEWIQRAGGEWDDYGAGIVYNNDDNMIYLTGEYRGTSDFGTISLSETGWGDVFVAGYTSTGMAMWVKTAGGSGATDCGKAIALDASNNIYVTGGYGKSATFPAPMNGDTSEVFIASYSKTGNLRWIVDAKGSGKEDIGKGIAVDQSGNVFVAGNYNEHLGTHTQTISIGAAHLEGFSNEDMFILKYSPVIPAGIDDVKSTFTEFYPNPAKDRLVIKSEDNATVRIETETGQLILNQFVRKGVSENIDVSGLSNGMYFVRMSNETRKLIKY